MFATKAVDLLSGPGGLASFLRRRQLGARLGGPSLPLDVGYSEDVPAGIRNAVRLWDQHCRFPGGCYQPASACHVHHVTHKARGGKTRRQRLEQTIIGNQELLGALQFEAELVLRLCRPQRAVTRSRSG